MGARGISKQYPATLQALQRIALALRNHPYLDIEPHLQVKRIPRTASDDTGAYTLFTSSVKPPLSEPLRMTLALKIWVYS
jgi:hypothetical protein